MRAEVSCWKGGKHCAVEPEQLEFSAVGHAACAIGSALDQPEFAFDGDERLQQPRVVATAGGVGIELIEKRRLLFGALGCRHRHQPNSGHHRDRRRIAKHRTRGHHNLAAAERDEGAGAVGLGLDPRDRVAGRIALDVEADVEHGDNLAAGRVDLEHDRVILSFAHRAQAAVDGPKRDFVDCASDRQHGNAGGLALARYRGGLDRCADRKRRTNRRTDRRTDHGGGGTHEQHGGGADRADAHVHSMSDPCSPHESHVSRSDGHGSRHGSHGQREQTSSLRRGRPSPLWVVVQD